MSLCYIRFKRDAPCRKGITCTITRATVVYLTSRFHVAVRLFSNRSQMTSKCGKNKKVAHEAQPSVSLIFLPHFDVLCDLLLKRLSMTFTANGKRLPGYTSAVCRLPSAVCRLPSCLLVLELSVHTEKTGNE